MDMIQFKRISIESYKHNQSQELHNKIYNTNTGSLFPYYISNPKSLFKSDLDNVLGFEM